MLKFGPTSGLRENMLLHFRSIIATWDQKEIIKKNASEGDLLLAPEDEVTHKIFAIKQKVFLKLNTIFIEEIM